LAFRLAAPPAILQTRSKNGEISSNRVQRTSLSIFRGSRAKGRERLLALTAQRFFRLLQDHGFPLEEVHRLFPEFTLERLNARGGLQQLLTPQLLQQAARLFGVRPGWLAGRGERIYALRTLTKAPEAFFREAGAVLARTAQPVIALAGCQTLDSRSKAPQPLLLIIAEEISETAPLRIRRYRIYRDVWRWEKRKCRIELKALATVFFEQSQRIIPVCSVERRVFAEIRAGLRVPWPLLHQNQSFLSLEDRGSERNQNEDWAELQRVSEHIRKSELRTVARAGMQRAGGPSRAELYEAVVALSESIKKSA